MPKIFVRPIGCGDIAAVAANIRAADRAEIIAAQGYDDPAGAIATSVLAATHVWTAGVDGVPACILGVGPASLLTGTGRPWLLGTDALDRYPVALNKRVKGYLAKMLEAYPHLENWVDGRNTCHVGWLRRLGFTIHPPKPLGIFGVPFHRFEMELR